MYAVLAILLILPLASSIKFRPVPILYVTKSDITCGPKQTYLFRLRTCGGKQFEHNIGTVTINFPDKKWQPFLGDFVYASVMDSHGGVLAKNGDSSGNYLTEFTFPYHSANGDLTLNITGGNAPVFKYTLTVTFNDTHHNASSIPSTDRRFIQTREEVEQWQDMKAAFPEVEAQDLVTVFKTSVTLNVATADAVALQLQYCFNPNEFPGFVTISTIASDEVSGFATYICTPDVQCTSTEAATYFDVSGASVNFVTVPIDAKDAGILKVLVRGDGRYSGNNKFVLAASKYIRPQN